MAALVSIGVLVILLIIFTISAHCHHKEEVNEKPKENVSGRLDNYISIDTMTGIQYERYCGQTLANMGYTNINYTPVSGDQGLDIIAYKDGKKIGVQCKRSSSKIGNKAVQEVIAGIIYYKCDEGIVITNNTFTASAMELAHSSKVYKVELWQCR